MGVGRYDITTEHTLSLGVPRVKHTRSAVRLTFVLEFVSDSKKKKKQLACLKEDVERFHAKRNRLHTELTRLSSERNSLRAELACLRQQQKQAKKRLSQRFKTVLYNAFAKCLNAAPVLGGAAE